ncbi:MAG: DNA primase DnaG [Candidatus Micrarchaeota archaeon]
MAKTYIDTVKYLIKANFEIDGLVEKPDIVGAVFGQTEGLLGDELDLRELQKNGRIGRIEVDSQNRSGKTVGTILVPSSLDMVETSILAAGLEVVDRVGPCEARIQVTRIEDSRNLKRRQVLIRAKNLLKTMIVEELPESKELSELVRDELKTSDVIAYGEDKLTAGSGVDSNDSIIVVEGRADVLNLLKNNFTNVIAVGGAKISPTIIKICRQKETTVFLDGDRGGDIILKELLDATDIDFIARAPSGLEVEELGRKELIKALRRKVPVEQADALQNGNKERRDRFDRPNKFQRPAFSRPSFQRSESFQPKPEVLPRQDAPAFEVTQEVDEEKAGPLKASLKELEGSLKARLLNEDGSIKVEVPIREIMRSLSEQENIYAVVLDGIVTQRLVDLASQKNAKFVVGIRSGNVSRKPPELSVILLES